MHIVYIFEILLCICRVLRRVQNGCGCVAGLCYHTEPHAQSASKTGNRDCECERTVPSSVPLESLRSRLCYYTVCYYLLENVRYLCQVFADHDKHCKWFCHCYCAIATLAVQEKVATESIEVSQTEEVKLPFFFNK